MKDRWRAGQGVQPRREQQVGKPEKPEAGRTIDVPTVKNRQRVEGVRQRTVVSAGLCKYVSFVLINQTLSADRKLIDLVVKEGTKIGLFSGLKRYVDLTSGWLTISLVCVLH